MPEYVEAPEKHIFSAYGTWLLSPQHRFIRQLQSFAQPDTHGDKTWDSSYLIMDYLLHRPLARKQKVLDVGCGWGPTAIYLARHGHKVTGMDLDEMVFPYLRVQAELNGVKVAEKISSMADLPDRDLKGVKLITGGDICFWDSLRDEWWKFIRRAEKNGVKRVILADPGRGPFLELVERCEKKYSTEFLHWYAMEPECFDGFIMDVRISE